MGAIQHNTKKKHDTIFAGSRVVMIATNWREHIEESGRFAAVAVPLPFVMYVCVLYASLSTEVRTLDNRHDLMVTSHRAESSPG